MMSRCSRRSFQQGALSQTVRPGTVGTAMYVCALAGASGAVLAFAVRTQAVAQPSTVNEVEEVVVSARKTGERLKDLPIAATVLDAAVIGGL